MSDGFDSDFESDFFEEGEDLPEFEEVWQPPVRCPKCHQDETRLVTMKFEVSVYVCEICNVQFEIEND